MSLEDFQLIGNETIDNSLISRDFLKICHQQAANLKASDQNVEFLVGENNNCHQIGNVCLQYELTIEKGVAVAANSVLVNGDAIRLVINAFAYCFREARLSTTGGSDIEHNKYIGKKPTIMRASTSKHGDLFSHFEKIDESETEIEITSLHHHLNSNHELAANKRKIKGYLPLEHIFRFCKTFKKITKQSGFHLTFKTADLQDIIYTTLGENIKVNFDKLFLFVPILLPDAQTQITFIDSIKDLSFDFWSTDRKTVDTQ